MKGLETVPSFYICAGSDGIFRILKKFFRSLVKLPSKNHIGERTVYGPPCFSFTADDHNPDKRGAD